MAITTSVLTGGTNNHTTSSEEVNGLATDFIAEGVVGALGNTSGVAPATGGFAVNAQGTPAMAVDVSAGVAYVQGTPTSQNAQTFRVKNSATSAVTISANASGSTKYDWVYIKLDPTNLNTPNTAGDNVATLVTSRSSSASSDDGTPPTYSYPLAVVTVANGAVSITNGNIRDIRIQAAVSASATSASTGWTDLGYNPATVTASGNRSYSLVFNSTDLTGTLSPGMRLRTTRTTAAPTQCTSLNGTTQFYSKTSPSGMTFTDDFVVSAWVKLSSYPTADASITSRYNATSGWIFNVRSNGRITLQGYNGGGGNFSTVDSYQSIPLNKWVHVAAQLDMSAFTATTLTSYVMIDGLDVPAFVGRGGTNPTALIQAGDLNIGTFNNGGGAGTFFPGKIAQVAIYSAKVTQATILASMNQGLAGTETSLISAYSFNNSINDLNANANNLTANGSAVATSTDSPFSINAFGTTDGSKDFAIITKATFSTNTTIVAQVPEGCTIPTSGGVSAVSYGTGRPYGFPAQRGKWRIITFFNQTQLTAGAIASATTIAPVAGVQITVPIGEFRIGFRGFAVNAHAGASFLASNFSLSTTTNSFSYPDLVSLSSTFSAASTETDGMVAAETDTSLSSSTVHYLVVNPLQNNTTVSFGRAGQPAGIIYADNDHL